MVEALGTASTHRGRKGKRRGGIRREEAENAWEELTEAQLMTQPGQRVTKGTRMPLVQDILMMLCGTQLNRI